MNAVREEAIRTIKELKMVYEYVNEKHVMAWKAAR